MPLIKGMEVVLIPAFDAKKYDELMIKYNPSHIVGVPSHYESIITSKKMNDQGHFLSCFSCRWRRYYET